MSEVKLGMVVLYNTTEEDQRKMAERMVLCNVRAQLPAMVVQVRGKKIANLNVFHDGQGMFWRTSVHQGEGEGQWCFIPEEEKDKATEGANPPEGDLPAEDLATEDLLAENIEDPAPPSFPQDRVEKGAKAQK